MTKYYDTSTRAETYTESDTTIISTDDRVKEFFKLLEEGKRLEFTADGLPLIVDIPEPTPEEILAKENQVKVVEAKQYLKDTDYKVLPDYDGSTEGIVEARVKARYLIRNLEGIKI